LIGASARTEGAAQDEVTFSLGRRHTVASAVLGGEREIIVRLPSDYEKTSWD
jgi:hypothetical protein